MSEDVDKWVHFATKLTNVEDFTLQNYGVV